jgi:hypothetical protein
MHLCRRYDIVVTVYICIHIVVYGGNSAVYTYSGGIRFSQSKPLRGRTTHIYYIYVCINNTQRILFLYFFPSFFRFIDLCNFFPVFCSTKMLDVYTRARTHTHTREKRFVHIVTYDGGPTDRPACWTSVWRRSRERITVDRRR